MAGPVQHLALFVTKTDAVGDDTAGLNTDRPAGHLNAWTDNPVTDPSTNNEVDGPNLIRNQLVESGTLLMRVLRDGGSGRPQYRVPGALTCSCGTYTCHFDETNPTFTLCTDQFPLNFYDLIVNLIDSGASNPDAWFWPGPGLPTSDDLNAMGVLDAGFVSSGGVFTNESDSACPFSVCRTFDVSDDFAANYATFTICTHEGFPLDFTARALSGGSSNPLIAPGPEVPTLFQINAIFQAANSTTDAPWNALSDAGDP